MTTRTTRTQNLVAAALLFALMGVLTALTMQAQGANVYTAYVPGALGLGLPR